MVAIGIDLGTTYSCVAVVRNSNVEIIANDQGNRTTPSYVAFTNTERLVGESAKNQASMNPINTIFDSKRLIGRKYDEPTVQSDIKLWPFTVKNDNNKPLISAEYKNEQKSFKPEEISAMILTKMKETAEAYLNEKVTDAVITVPAYFNNEQRQSTKDAGAIAGLNVLRIINEPTASAIAYGMDNKSDKEKNVLIYDYGGGTMDVSILSIDEGVFEVLATAGDSHLGGSDLDQRLTEFCCKDFKKKNKLDITSNPRSLKRLLTACEKAKRTLSSSTTANIEIDSLCEGIDFNLTITRARFDDICSDIFKNTMKPVEKVLRDSKLAKSQIDEVVLVGGSTRIPKIQQLLSEYFNGKQLCKTVNPDEAVAHGAAVQASILSGNSGGLKDEILLIDIIPLSLGIETSGQVMTNIIDRNSTIPCKKEKIFSTYQDNQPAVTIKIFEGERPMTKDNNLLGEFTMTGLPPKRRGEPQIEVTLDLDSNGILTVTALEKSSGISQHIEIKNENGRLSKADIERMVSDAEKFKEEDNIIKEKIQSKNTFENTLYTTKDLLEKPEIKDKFSEEDKKTIEDTLAEHQLWFDTDSETHTKEDYELKQTELQNIIAPIMQKNQNSETPPAQPETEQTSDGPTVEEVD
jgi:L1 cell adhesion molecule like protein